MLLLRVFLGRWTGSSSTTGTGTIITSGKVNAKASSSTIGVGNIFTLAKVGNKPNPGAQVTGFGTITTAGKINKKSSTATTGTGTITTSGVRKRYGASATTSTGTITTAGKNPHITYYDIRLTATNSQGSNSKTRTEYITANRLLTGSAALVGSGTITTVANGPDIRTWSVRLTATNSSGSNTKTLTNYITVLQPTPGAHLDGSGTIFTAGKPKKYASSSVVGTGTITTRLTVKGVSSVVGTGTITTSSPKVKAYAAGGWGLNWGVKWGGALAISVDGVGTITTTPSGHGVVLGTSVVTGTGTITTSAKVGEKSSSATTGSGTITTTGKKGLHGVSSIVATGTITTRGGTSALNQASLRGTGTITTRAKVNSKTSAHLVGTGTITTTFSTLGLPDLTEFPAVDLDLTENTSSDLILVGAGVSPIDLTEDSA